MTTITTRDQLAALPVDTVIRDANDDVLVKGVNLSGGNPWMSAGRVVWSSDAKIALPAETLTPDTDDDDDEWELIPSGEALPTDGEPFGIAMYGLRSRRTPHGITGYTSTYYRRKRPPVAIPGNGWGIVDYRADAGDWRSVPAYASTDQVRIIGPDGATAVITMEDAAARITRWVDAEVTPRGGAS